MDPHSAARSNCHARSPTSQRYQARDLRTASLAPRLLVGRRPRNSDRLPKEANMKVLDNATEGMKTAAWFGRSGVKIFRRLQNISLSAG
jgi:hypothetical protein